MTLRHLSAHKEVPDLAVPTYLYHKTWPQIVEILFILTVDISVFHGTCNLVNIRQTKVDISSNNIFSWAGINVMRYIFQHVYSRIVI